MFQPIASFSFDEISGDILDHSGHARDFTSNNNLVTQSTGQNNFGVTKNDVGMPVIASPSFVTSDYWTIMFSQKGIADTGTWWVRLYNNSEDTGHGILNLGGGLRVRIRKDGSSIQSDPVDIPDDDGWHHYTITYDGTNAKLYIDGILVGITGTAALPIATHDHIDMMEFSVANTFVDNMRFFDADLTQEDIEHWMNTPVVDDTASATDIFIYNGISWIDTNKRIWDGAIWTPTP